MSFTDTMPTLEPTTLVGSLVVELIPDTGKADGPLFRLPGGAPADGNVLSGRQVRTILGYVVGHFAPTDTLAEALTTMRRSAGISPAQYDFGLVEWVVGKIRKDSADNITTQRQDDLLVTCLQALTGVERHWDDKIAERIAAAPTTRREQVASVLMNAITTGTSGAVDKAMNVFSANFGKPRPAAVRFADITGSSNPLQAELDDPATSKSF